MEISFPDDQIQRLFERRSLLEAEFGCELARLICRRINVLQEAKRLSAVPAVPPPECRPEKGARWSVALGDTHRLTFKPLPASAAGAAKQIQILGVTSS